MTNFTYQHGLIDDANPDASASTEESNIGFYVNEANSTRNNLDGIVSIVGNVLTNAQYHGIDIFNFSGTITNATISNNTITSTTSIATSQGGGIRLIAFGSATTIANVTLATITNNVVSNFPSGWRIQAQGGNGNLAGPAGVFGTAGHPTNKIAITGNTLTGNPKFGTFAIVTAVNGRGQGNFDISSNGTVANPITNSIGTAISVGVIRIWQRDRSDQQQRHRREQPGRGTGHRRRHQCDAGGHRNPEPRSDDHRTTPSRRRTATASW